MKYKMSTLRCFISIAVFSLALSACRPGAQIAPTDSGQPETFLGDTLERDGYFLTVLAVEDPALPSPLYFPEEGKRLIAVEIVVGNVSGTRFGVNPLNVTLVDEEGRFYPPELGAREGQIATIVIDPGERVRGWVAFKIPDRVVPAALQMSKDMFGEPFFRVGVVSPPAAHTPAVLWFERAELPFSGIGERVVGAGYAMTVLKIENAAMPAPRYLIEPGQRLVAVEVHIANLSDAIQTVSPLYFVLVDSEGFVYPATAGAIRDQIASVDLNSEEEVQGWVAFSVPERIAVGSLKFIPSVVSDQSLQVNLTQ